MIVERSADHLAEAELEAGDRRDSDAVNAEFAPGGLRCILDVALDGPDRFTVFVAADLRPVGPA